MNDNLKECVILGYSQYANKDNGEAMLRIVLGVESENEKYNGIQPATAFLDYDSTLEESLKRYLNDKNSYNAYYQTTDNIITGKTKVTKIIIK